MGETGSRRRASPVRLTLAFELGKDIDGAWWPHTGRIAAELPDLISVLGPRLGDVTGIDVNWTSLQNPPDLNWVEWRGKQQHVISVSGTRANARLLLVPHSTNSALAKMVLRRAAQLPIDAAHRNTQPFERAGSILDAARLQVASDR
jgi:hypothetical protein